MSLYQTFKIYTVLHRLTEKGSVEQLVFKKTWGEYEQMVKIKTVDDAVNLASKLGVDDAEDFLYETNITNSYKTSGIGEYPYSTDLLVVEGKVFRLAPHPEAKPFNPKKYAHKKAV